MVEADRQEVKEGRKISSARLKALKDARDALDALIKECEAEKAADKKPEKTAQKNNATPGRAMKSIQTIKIIY